MPGTIGTQSDAATTVGGSGTLSAKLRLMTTQLNALASLLGATSGTTTVITDRQTLTPVASGFTSGRNISAATTLTPPSGATKLLVQTITQNIRYTIDGTSPTASLGFQLRAGDPPIVIPVWPGTTIKVIQEAATAVLTEQWCS